jgi:hypothetical protein
MHETSSKKMLDRARRRSRRIGWILLETVVGLAVAGRPAFAQDEPSPYDEIDDEYAAQPEPQLEPQPEPQPQTPPPAAEEPSQAGPQPTLFHVPPSSANADEPLEVTATVGEAWQVRTVELVYRRLDRDGWMRVPFRQVSTGDFVAVVPASDVAAPAIEYYVESLDRENRTRRHFASPEQPHRVEVVGLTGDQEEALEEERFGGRHRFAARSDWSSFGDRSWRAWVPDPENYPPEQVQQRTDDYVEFHADYTYRILGIVQAIHFGFGVLRGHAPALDYRAGLSPGDPDWVSPDERKLGYNYGWTGITFQFHRYFGAGLDIYLGATQLGFDGGGGGFLRIGNTAETHFDVGIDYVSNVGYRTWATFMWDTVPYVPMSLTAEFTDWPNPGDGNGDGVRLWYQAEAHVWQGLILEGRVGYAARHGSNTGGPIVGGGVAYEF